MEVILIEGVKYVGKTKTCRIIRDILLNNGFEYEKDRDGEELVEDIENPDKDFICILVNITCKTRVLINSGSDLKEIIEKFDEFYRKNFDKGFDVLTSAIRPRSVNRYLHKWIKDTYKGVEGKNEFVVSLDEKSIDSFDNELKISLNNQLPEILRAIQISLECDIIINLDLG